MSFTAQFHCSPPCIPYTPLPLHTGGDLSYHLEKEGRFPVPRVQLYLAELMLALDYLQNNRIIHRDLKPANMLLDSQGHIHLTDFNVACIVRDGRTVTSMTGTKPYMGTQHTHTHMHAHARTQHTQTHCYRYLLSSSSPLLLTILFLLSTILQLTSLNQVS